ncbi:FAD:protein FMN transferase [Candidatus Saccharibacteria bacterium]|nr:FAD:protein FMN transferase [Candidatus Saccharibacteria bacterium]
MPSLRSSNKQKPSITLSFEAIGTVWRINYIGEESHANNIASLISARIVIFDKNYSRFRTDSLITQFSRQQRPMTPIFTTMPADFDVMIRFYRQLYDVSDGLVTPLIGTALDDAGYDTAYSFQPRTIRATPAWDNAMTYHRGSLTIKQPILLDFGAAGKGYLVDILADLLTQQSITTFTIDAGGDIRHQSATPNYIGLEDPSDVTKVIGLAELKNASICGSAGNRRAWKGYNHILNPDTKLSPVNISAVWVIAETTMIADGLATALSFVEPCRLADFRFEYLLIRSDGSRQSSPNFPVRFFDTPMVYELK